ncbi:hypothetical protein ABIC60_003710 [Phyllobacterium ifriqiyense]
MKCKLTHAFLDRNLSFRDSALMNLSSDINMSANDPDKWITVRSYTFDGC